MSNDIWIDEMVGFLSREAPDHLSSLRTEFPNHHKLLKPGIVMGVESDSPDWKFFAKVAKDFLERSIPVAESAADVAARRLRRAARLEFCAHLVLLVGSATTAGLLIGSIADYKAMLSSLVALAGSVLTVSAAYSRISLSNKKTLADHYQSLTVLLPEMQVARINLLAVLELSTTQQPKLLTSILSQLERMAKLLSEAQRGIGFGGVARSS